MPALDLVRWTYYRRDLLAFSFFADFSVRMDGFGLGLGCMQLGAEKQIGHEGIMDVYSRILILHPHVWGWVRERVLYITY